MLFNSATFILFYCIVIITYALLRRRVQLKKGLLLIASYVFYGAWNPPFIILILFSTIIDWYLAKAIERSKDNKIKKCYLLLSLVSNLGLLAIFKYSNFILESIAFVSKSDFTPLNIILPVGISFYTFQTLSYSIDVYRGSLKTSDSFFDYALYVSFFPQLVAGPIVRASDFLPQFKNYPNLNFQNFIWGLQLFTIGLFQKVVIADYFLAPIANKLYATSKAINFEATLVGTLAFSGQIFCDFSGYSLCAIGIALTFGFKLPDNFRYPYASTSFSEFWRRWHISLSSWLRDYLYIPLGGNRSSKFITYRNLFITMLLGGLWHGSSWNFVIWGALHGAFLAFERFMSKRVKLNLPTILKSIIVFILVNLIWIFFRADTLNSSLKILMGLFDFTSEKNYFSYETHEVFYSLGIMTIILTLQFIVRNKPLSSIINDIPRPIFFMLFLIMFTMILLLNGDDNAFIYFQF